MERNPFNVPCQLAVDDNCGGHHQFINHTLLPQPQNNSQLAQDQDVVNRGELRRAEKDLLPTARRRKCRESTRICEVVLASIGTKALLGTVDGETSL
jgi:hypothetical protein